MPGTARIFSPRGITRSLAVLLFAAWIASNAQGGTSPNPDRGRERTGYSGDAACTRCHQQLAETYRGTAHHLASQLPSSKSILGSFETPSNRLWIQRPQGDPSEPILYFEMNRTSDGFYETAVAELGTKRLTHTERIDLVFGSGHRGQTYLYWSGNELSELPVSFWTDGGQWINSPGYRDGTANFTRHADPRCMECHTTYIHALSPLAESFTYEAATLVPGIGCETCHGPGARHVALESAHPAGRRPEPVSPRVAGIVNPATLSRDRQVDICALCHNGTQGTELKPAFSFVPGENLADFIATSTVEPQDQLDVHGNQVGLLERSRCFRASPNMSCATCHDVHAPEQPASSYSSRCLRCHSWQSCGASKTLGQTIVKDCIDCHMPMQQTQAIVSVTAGRTIRTSIRTHWIKVYPAAQTNSP